MALISLPALAGAGLLAGMAVLVAVLDACNKIDLTRPAGLFVCFLVYMSLPAVYWLLEGAEYFGLGVLYRVAYWVPVWLFGGYLFLRLHILPWRPGQKTTTRLSVMMGGRALVHAGFWALLACVAGLVFLLLQGAPWTRVLGNGVFGLAASGLLFLNGTVRMFFTSRRLSLVYRALLLCLWWVPFLNLLVLRKCCRLCWEEYDFALYKASLHDLAVEGDLCKTRYPLVMVHGVLFRDLRYFNYWGRIPKELLRLGATVYYGNQEAVGTVARNAADLRAKILEVLEETGCEKVNIIAHSKGGLDSRYCITALRMAPYVASLTTISTPHRGVKFVDGACRLPEGLYRFIAGLFDGTFRRMGDKEPDFYTATRQFATQASRQFNEEVPDAPGVYYQSYATKMRGMTSDSLLCIPYCLVRRGEGDNDGLVSLESAKWGEFRGTLTAPGRRGISHGDIIDLKREDIKGFDVCETYVRIVSELKAKGY